MRPFLAAIVVSMAGAALAQTATTSVSSTPSGSQTVVQGGEAAGATTVVTTTPHGTTVKTTAVDPKSKMICQQVETLGTRLGGHKICMTREQWRESVAQDRAAVDHAQVSRGIIGN